jgi:Protein of unknown function (DUF4026) C-terminal
VTSATSPSRLNVIWPWEEAPTREEVRLRLGAFREVEDLEVRDERVLWSSVWRPLAEHGEDDGGPPDETRPDPALVLWAARLDDERKRWFDAPREWGPGEEEVVARARWWLGVEATLDPRLPLDSYQHQLRRCLELCPELPAVFDASSTSFRSGAQVRRLVDSPVAPRAMELFMVHAIASDDDETCWLHTHGLQRGDMFDLEMLAVPRELFRAAGALIHDFVGQFLGRSLPPPLERVPLGLDVEVGWRPLEDVLPHLAPGTLGGVDDRDEQHRGWRAVLIDPACSSQDPLDSVPLQALGPGDKVSYLSAAETQRRAALARARWPQFGMLFATHKADQDWSFQIKLAYPIDGQEQSREHLWFQVLAVVPDRVQARLLSSPRAVALTEGDEGWHDLERLSDWSVQSPHGPIGPGNVALE